MSPYHRRVSGHSHGYGVYHHHAHYSYEPIPGGNNYNTTVLEGDEAVLRCRLKEPAGRKVSEGWWGMRLMVMVVVEGPPDGGERRTVVLEGMPDGR